ncbi:MAG: DUF4956 domain-containing protein [Firmicutes bacterium]|nr:DUF4956 domain-containing protein [Bacillota bacterium]
MFNSILEAQPNGVWLMPFEAAVFLCIFSALATGVLVAVSYRIKNEFYTKTMIGSLVVLPLIIFTIIVLIGGRSGTGAMIGTGLAVAGAFALVRFRSVPGNARDIAFVFVSLASGVALGVGQVVFESIIVVLVCGVSVVIKFLPIDKKRKSYECELRITIPDDLDYENQFQSILSFHASTFQVIRIKTSRMGSLFEIRYKLFLKAAGTEKKLIDELRVKNGNLPIVIKRYTENVGEL